MSSISVERKAARLRLVQEHTRYENAHDLDGIMSTFGERPVLRANADAQEGHAAVKHFYGEFLTGFPDLRLDIVDLHCGDEGIASEMMLSGTHTAMWMGVPPSTHYTDGATYTVGDWEWSGFAAFWPEQRVGQENSILAAFGARRR